MGTHSSVFACRIPGMGEPGGLPSMGLHRVRHDWSDLAAAAARVRNCHNNHSNQEKKKLIFSQCRLAASQGSWLSLGDHEIKKGWLIRVR